MRQRAVFSLTVAPASAAATDPGLERVARAVNLLTASGVPKKQLDFVVLLSEGATDSALADPAYRARHGVANPNLGLIAQLSAAGVQVLVCGQALRARQRSEAHTSELQSLMRISYAVFCLYNTKKQQQVTPKRC